MVGNSPKSGDDRIGQLFCLRHRGFDRVSARCRGGNREVRKGAVDDRRMRIVWIFFKFLALMVRIAFSNVLDIHTDTQKSELIFRYREDKKIEIDRRKKRKYEKKAHLENQ